MRLKTMTWKAYVKNSKNVYIALQKFNFVQIFGKPGL